MTPEQKPTMDWVKRYDQLRTTDNMTDSINQLVKEVEQITMKERDKEIADLKLKNEILSDGIYGRIKADALKQYPEWKDDFCKRKNICPVCITGGYDCDSDHK